MQESILASRFRHQTLRRKINLEQYFGNFENKFLGLQQWKLVYVLI